jgi:beta-barrel assembly-enhancing protease
MNYVAKPLIETADISRGKTTLRSLIKGTISALLVLALLYLALGLIGDLLARTIPDRWERQLSGVASVKITDTISNELQGAEAILAKLMKDEPLRELNYTLFLVDLKKPNAVAVPGGGIGLTPELLKSVQSEAGLALVIAHELGHHQHRHILRSVGRRLIFSLVAALLFNYDEFSTVNSALQLAENGHSRDQERDADEFAMRLIYKKYGDTKGALEFFEKLENEKSDSLWQKYAGSHPLTHERLQHLRALKKELSAAANNPSSKQ